MAANVSLYALAPNTPDVDRAVLSLLGFGAANARTARELGGVLGVSERAVRRAIEVLIKDHGMAIATSTEEEPRGAFLLETEAEYQRYRRQLLSRQEELSLRIRALDRAWAERRSPVSLLEMMA